MCGIVAGIAQRNVVPILLEGLRRLEYRGYDSAGLAVIESSVIKRKREVGKVSSLEALIKEEPISGNIGIAHTRWATHGKPSTANAHPHMSGFKVAVVHNGIIENYAQLKELQLEKGYEFTSQTDTEVIVHGIYEELKTENSFMSAVLKATNKLEGAYALAIVSQQHCDTLVVCRKGSPLVIGVGIGEYFAASDVAAILPVTQRFIFLEDGDIAEIKLDAVKVIDSKGNCVTREIKETSLSLDAVDKGNYRHYMLKEIHEQPDAIARTIEGKIINGRVSEQALGHSASEIFDYIKSIQIIACGTSFHAGLVARYWFEGFAGIPCNVEIASEYRYRSPVLSKDTLIITISQSGETADTIAALGEARRLGAKYALTICNVLESSLGRASDLVIQTNAGPEIGVASTKAFVTQLTVLMLLVIVVGRRFKLPKNLEEKLTRELINLPAMMRNVLSLDEEIKIMAEQFSEKHHALFLGRGAHYPIAMEGALKLKEISYIHAEAYPAGELKHGPLALVDSDMPVVTVAPNNSLLEKLKSNIQEVSARGGQLIVFMDEHLVSNDDINLKIIKIPSVEDEVSAIIYAVPLQLLAYYVAVLKGTDVDQPRNLAKSVTVE